MPVARYYHSQIGLTACGGTESKSSCATLVKGEWNVKFQFLQHQRFEHVAWLRPDGTFQLMHGYNSQKSEVVDIANDARLILQEKIICSL